MSRSAPTRLAKRAIDLVLGTVLAAVTLPVTLALAVAVGVTLRSWPLFSQRRIGRGGRPIRVVKLRTLPTGTPRYASRYEVAEVPVPQLCETLRRLHLDELPQLFMVVTGRLSLVGPRPEMPFLAETMDASFVNIRTQVRPGCTGMWQISPANDRLIREAPSYDLWYVEAGGLRVDVWVLWRTVLLMLRLSGPVELTDVPAWATWSRRSRSAAVSPSHELVQLLDSGPL